MTTEEQKARVEAAGHEFDPYLTLSPEDRLRELATGYAEADGDDLRRFWEGRIIELTYSMHEHPKWFGDLDIPCHCGECCSCA